MKKPLKIVIYVAIALVVLAVVSAGVARFTHSRAVQKYQKDKEAYTKQVDELTKKLIAEKARADEHEQQALVLSKQVPALEAELARFGAAGQKAVERQEQAKVKYEAEVNTIRGNNDACVLCRNLCAERASLSDINDPARDYRCAANYCDTACAGR